MTMLKCGCRAVGSIEAADGSRVPYCVTHNCTELAPDPDLTGRRAKCPYCKNTRESSTTLPFFQYRAEAELDSYYCGCRGWD